MGVLQPGTMFSYKVLVLPSPSLHYARTLSRYRAVHSGRASLPCCINCPIDTLSSPTHAQRTAFSGSPSQQPAQMHTLRIHSLLAHQARARPPAVVLWRMHSFSHCTQPVQLHSVRWLGDLRGYSQYNPCGWLTRVPTFSARRNTRSPHMDVLLMFLPNPDPGSHPRLCARTVILVPGSLNSVLVVE